MTVSVSTPLNFSFTFTYCPNTDIFVSTPFLYHVSPDTGLTSRHTIPSVFCVTPTRISLHISKPYPKPNSSGAPSLSCSALDRFIVVSVRHLTGVRPRYLIKHRHTALRRCHYMMFGQESLLSALCYQI
ncbi:hypothetical protein M6B38_232660 [Iris pallida]|uniref:Uncharacterized protein n=1 Tax=Iris pallida TaxID=29817 RepID=A0AAX6DRV8_IRIPA|nr:hypothetical protein M6B38_232660 [Iris pallida]